MECEEGYAKKKENKGEESVKARKTKNTRRRGRGK